MSKILYVAANPVGTSPLDLGEEFHAINAKISGSLYRDQMNLVSDWQVRLDDLEKLLMQQKPDVVHFSGHGVLSGAICLVGPDRSSKAIKPEELEHLFADLKHNVKLVVFNACDTEAQAKAVAKVIDCSVGMSREIADDKAIAFAEGFYQALGNGESVRTAYQVGLNRLHTEGIADPESLAKLYTREVDGVDPAAVIFVEEKKDLQAGVVRGGLQSLASLIRTHPDMARWVGVSGETLRSASENIDGIRRAKNVHDALQSAGFECEHLALLGPSLRSQANDSPIWDVVRSQVHLLLPRLKILISVLKESVYDARDRREFDHVNDDYKKLKAALDFRDASRMIAAVEGISSLISSDLSRYNLRECGETRLGSARRDSRVRTKPTQSSSA